MILENVANTPDAWSQRATAREPWAAAGWSQQGQAKRMAKALAMLAPRSGESLLDYGCGPGALCSHLAAWDEFGADGIWYLGYDWARGMVERARREYPTRAFTTEISRVTSRRFSLVACIGPFNLRDFWSAEHTWLTLTSLWNLTDRALFVSLYAGDDERCIRYQASEVADFADRAATRWQLERHLDNDLALLLTR